jgi:hypothetical protein
MRIRKPAQSMSFRTPGRAKIYNRSMLLAIATHRAGRLVFMAKIDE